MIVNLLKVALGPLLYRAAGRHPFGRQRNSQGESNMRTIRRIAALAGAFYLAGAPAPFAQQPPPAIGHTDKLALALLQPKSPVTLTVTSPAFKNGGDIPLENTQYRGNVFPGVAWTSGPAGTRSYVIIMQGEGSDTSYNTSIHLTLFNVPASVTKLRAGMTTPPPGAGYGANVHGLNQPYAGPHTHTIAKHAYHLQVFALDIHLQLEPTASFDALESAMAGHVLASGEVVGLASKDPDAASSTSGTEIR
jgi:para-nitrobenzyl esterase